MEYQSGSPETALFASTLHMCLTGAGWKIDEPKEVPSITARRIIASAEITLLAYSIDEIAPPRGSLGALWNALEAAVGKYKVAAAGLQSIPKDEPLILVG